ncbi:hypothetical protein [Pontibacter rugosus]|uniref:Uncharacterized protein n=1 Tax=Pontibacter rugosus TaxID=1745966 RepID=A0ABW3SUB2_9BACT
MAKETEAVVDLATATIGMGKKRPDNAGITLRLSVYTSLAIQLLLLPKILSTVQSYKSYIGCLIISCFSAESTVAEPAQSSLTVLTN